MGPAVGRLNMDKILTWFIDATYEIVMSFFFPCLYHLRVFYGLLSG